MFYDTTMPFVKWRQHCWGVPVRLAPTRQGISEPTVKPPESNARWRNS